MENQSNAVAVAPVLSEAQKNVLVLIAAGESVKAHLVKQCPRGWVAKQREQQRVRLRKNSEVLLAKLGTLGFKVEKLDASFDGESGDLVAKCNKRGDEVINVRMVKRAEAAGLSMEDAMLTLAGTLSKEQFAMVQAAVNGKIVAKAA